MDNEIWQFCVMILTNIMLVTIHIIHVCVYQPINMKSILSINCVAGIYRRFIIPQIAVMKIILLRAQNVIFSYKQPLITLTAILS